MTPEMRTEMAMWVRETLGQEKAAIWWQTPNPLLGNIAPWQMCMNERLEEKLYAFIEDAITHNTLSPRESAGHPTTDGT